jgi:hypothetical protein
MRKWVESISCRFAGLANRLYKCNFDIGCLVFTKKEGELFFEGRGGGSCLMCALSTCSLLLLSCTNQYRMLPVWVFSPLTEHVGASCWIYRRHLEQVSS